MCYLQSQSFVGLCKAEDVKIICSVYVQHFGPALGDRACLVFYNTVWENDQMGTFPPKDLLFALLHSRVERVWSFSWDCVVLVVEQLWSSQCVIRMQEVVTARAPEIHWAHISLIASICNSFVTS